MPFAYVIPAGSQHHRLALDGVLAGASQRDIATVLCGTVLVRDRWQPDGELRAHVRYLVRRSRAFMNDAYRELLNQPEIVLQAETSPPADSP